MAIRAVPANIFAAVERIVPGAIRTFQYRVEAAHRGLPAPIPTSYWRSPSQTDAARAARVAKGLALASNSPFSQHLIGTGIDLAYRSSRDRAAARAAMQRQGLVVIDEGDHLHAQLFVAGVAERSGIFRAIGLA